VNKVLLTGRLTRDPEMRSLASGKVVTTFTVASNEFLGSGKEKAEYSPVVTWDRLAEIAGRYLGKGQQVAIEGRLQTRSWDDDRGQRQCQVIRVGASSKALAQECAGCPDSSWRCVPRKASYAAIHLAHAAASS
jgi:single stranded DNA-binding protein